MSLYLTLPVPPRINEKFISRSYVVSKKHREFKEYVRYKCLSEHISPVEGEVSVKIAWYRARRAGDIDMFVKTLLDSLQVPKGSKWGCYVNDSAIKRLEIERHDTDKGKPRVEVEVSEYGR